MRTSELKSFGMTAQLIESDIQKIEHDYQLELQPPNGKEINEKYYPQFDQLVRDDASKMSKYYELFYCLEKTIRELIALTLKDSKKQSNWWNNHSIPQRIFDDVNKRMTRELDSGITLRSDHEIDYTTFGELSEIIKHNWDEFGSIFSSLRAVEKILSNLNILRGPIAHCGHLAEDEVLRLELSIRDWFRAMEQA
ncbi:hypothetical protein KS4_25970 [Poriferisphaera corsica]|uniref:Swt1-like HEPN domain-containing protein n=1 Tax=Poriferisphaera corsica TaxID=2528020 RepID=A0A517YWE7_9BACT|nr:Swt1 family HEPN domain-containing protein [Poriferisphaera corsica]QDU34527.1 hypothetical protein KS4_25970 [Poriferisphaera corsica]